MDPLHPNSGFSRGTGDPGQEFSSRPPRLRKRRRGIAVLPALFTLGNCLSGFISINYAARGINNPDNFLPSNYAIAGYFIFLAMIFDMFDGFVARLTRSASDFGAELDSLADMVSFGIAPAFLSMRLIGDLFSNPALSADGKTPFASLPGPFADDLWLRLFWVIGATYVCCTALRLARFNVMNKHDALSHMSFRGMPSPGAAAVVAATVIFYESLRRSDHKWLHIPAPLQDLLKAVFPYVLPAVLLSAALLMVSRFSYTHLINRFLRGRKRFGKLVGLLFLGMVIVWEPQVSAVVAIYIYALSAPVSWLYRKITRRPELKP